MNKMLKVSLLMILLCLSSGASAEDYWQQYLRYEMDVALDPED